MSDGQQGDMATANSSPSEISTSDGSSYSDGSYELTLTTITSPTVEPECSTTFVQSPEPQTLWRPIDDFCLIASVMHYCDIEFVYRFTRLGRSFTLEEVQSRWEELFADGSVLEQRREEITKLSDDQIFPELLRLQMNPVEVCALAEVPSTTTADVEFFRNLQAKKSKVFHELREPARLLEFWTDLRKANLLCDQKINPAPTGNVVLSLSDCSDEQSDQSSDSSTSKDSSSSEGSFEEDDFYKLSRLQKTVVALKQEINIIKEHIRGLVTALELAPETEGWTDSMAASSVVLHVFCSFGVTVALTRMDDFSHAADLSKMNSKQREDLVTRVKQQVVLANVQELLQNISEKCLKACIKKPGKTLDSSEQKCLSFCVDRYIETMNLVAATYRERLQEG
uniref:Tim10-like domain-containing protein n=1 Tax=Trichuris muris TaxID=70415 RepID=A0A5S6QHZ9_TRIMR